MSFGIFTGTFSSIYIAAPCCSGSRSAGPVRMRAAHGRSARARQRRRRCLHRRRHRRHRRPPPSTAARTLVDTHCHLGDAAFDADRDAVLAHAKAVGVTHVVVIGESVAGSERAVALAARCGRTLGDGRRAPARSEQLVDGARQRVRELLARRGGRRSETGLDYHYMHSPRETQRRAFAAHLELGQELGKP